MAIDLSADSDPDVNIDDDESDTSSIIEIRQDEFPDYFVERDGRLFPSHGGPYLLPVDGHEQRVRFSHINFVHPLSDKTFLGRDGTSSMICSEN
jgi:hypothetical protein